MALNQTFTVSSDRRADIEQLIRALPAMLAGKIPDRGGIVSGMRARLGHTFLSLVKEDFVKKSRGQAGADGQTWAPLSAAYLAYRRPFNNGRKPPRGPGKAPGNKNGFLDKQQLQRWRKIFADRYAFFVMRESEAEAKAHAAAIAWATLKAEGAKTKIEEFGRKRVAGSDYNILRDRSTLLNSLSPGVLTATGYQPKADQVYEDHGSRLVVGTNVPYAKYHHYGKGRRHRPLWPEKLPDDWWRQIEDQMLAGVVRIGQLFGGK
jgi:hypothetical protein